MWITLLFIFAVLIAIGYRLFLSNDDAIPASVDDSSQHFCFKRSHLKPIKQNFVSIRALPQSVDTSLLLQSMSMALTNQKSSRHNSSSANTSFQQAPRKHLVDSFIQQQKFTRFEQITFCFMYSPVQLRAFISIDFVVL